MVRKLLSVLTLLFICYYSGCSSVKEEECKYDTDCPGLKVCRNNKCVNIESDAGLDSGIKVEDAVGIDVVSIDSGGDIYDDGISEGDVGDIGNISNDVSEKDIEDSETLLDVGEDDEEGNAGDTSFDGGESGDARGDGGGSGDDGGNVTVIHPLCSAGTQRKMVSQRCEGDLAVDDSGSNIFCVGQGSYGPGKVYKISVENLTVSVIASIDEFYQPTEGKVYGRHYYLAQAYGLYRVDVGGGSAEKLSVDFVSDGPAAFDVTDTYIYLINGYGEIRRRPQSAASWQTIATTGFNPYSSGMIVHGGYIYWSASDASSNTVIYRISESGGSKEKIADISANGQYSGCRGPFVYNQYLYCRDNWGIARVPVTGGAIEHIADATGNYSLSAVTTPHEGPVVFLGRYGNDQDGIWARHLETGEECRISNGDGVSPWWAYNNGVIVNTDANSVVFYKSE